MTDYIALMSGKTAQQIKPYTYHSAQALIARLRRRWEPPPPIKLSEWAEDKIELPEEMRTRPGKYRNWPYMREILDVIGDQEHEKVTILKSARIGYTVGLVAAIGAVAVNDPSQILLLMPTDEDADEIAVDTVEPIFDETPDLKGMMKRDRSGRNNMNNRRFIGGGSLKIRSGRAPRKLRRIDAQYLFIDEADGFEVTKEGDAISLAEKRTLAKQRKKIVKGSTPTDEELSVVWRDFQAGDQRVFEVPCPLQNCGERSEIIWEDIRYKCSDTSDEIEDVYWQCPKCRQRVDERYKPAMIAAGKYRRLKPEIKNHASFRINALSSLLPQATWRKICAMHVEAKRNGLADLQVFTNTILGRPWALNLQKVDAHSLMARSEPIGAPSLLAASRNTRGFVIPPEVLALAVGADVQDNRIEATVVGVTANRAPVYLHHCIFEGNTLQPEVWVEFDSWHRNYELRHPNGWFLKVDAMAVDSGGREGRTQIIYDWCAERLGRGVYAIKGDDGPDRKAWKKAKKVKGAVSLYIVGTDQLKTLVLDQVARKYVDDDGVIDPYAARFSDSLELAWYEQLTNEVRRIVLKPGGRPQIEFKLKRAGLAVEALDCAVYAQAVMHSTFFARIDFKARAARVKTPVSPSAETGAPQARPASKPRQSIADIVAKMQGRNPGDT